ncbi:WUSCHEL-related homeobox 13 [Glycine soja]|uniref:WUSCHEL-related homeobox 13 n=1 Tax=Glycine soja TaxID=3848 RepID=A0A445F363_GLYSO|nr:WUSCHEL-related homeobox 13 [Glycine soja]
MVNVVELQKQLQRWQQSGNVNVNVNVDANGELMYVKVMTDEQLETLRKQIAVYGTICEQLIEMHRTLSAQQDLAGSYSKVLFISSPLYSHWLLNVYNWFQNRRARSKRRLQNVAPSNTESEVDTEVDSKNKKTKAEEEFQSQHNITTSGGAEKLCFQNPQVYSDHLHYLNPDSNKPYSMFQSDCNLKSTRNSSHVSVFNEMLSNSRSEYVGGKMEVGGSVSYNLFHQTGDCNLAG